MTEPAPRDTIADHVSENPGVHFNELVRSVGLATGQVQYHMYRLLDDGVVEDASLYGRTHYYPDGYPDDRRGAVALLRRETAREIVVYLIRNGERRPDEVAESLGIARSTLEWHLGRLKEESLVRKRRGPDGRVTLSAVEEETNFKALSDVSPSLAETLVDRFVTMVDRMVE
jgi:predicted transcriptional regulator